MKEWFKEKKDLIKLFFMSLFKQIGYVVLMFLVWMSMEDLILPILHRVTDSTISKLHMDWVVYLTLLAAVILFIYFGIKIIKKYQVSKWFLSNLILISLIYTRYRFYSNEFVFWSWNNLYYLDLLYVLSGIVLLCSLVIFIISLIKIESKNTINSHLLRDDELEDPTDDCLGYNEQVVSLSNLLETVDVSRRAYSVGIVGEWGIGKSSMLKLFAKCKSDKNNIIVQYNPRHAKNTQLIQEDFFNQLRAKLSYYNGNIRFLLWQECEKTRRYVVHPRHGHLADGVDRVGAGALYRRYRHPGDPGSCHHHRYPCIGWRSDRGRKNHSVLR